ncbi:unnamed protein product [Bursaphelenchus xylophilus]|uniref:(pine wood nematode) hypothetical protein n=1 Tax=Bursaphelenchus xylophilus TaxID=6326 RepID=A0A1I7S9M8_BURXY|nr:unnamed protein product [Bursaphelenchus xylophilus]CAG9131925.1 unnamed protein product [Bursaphelenchus xylophilus]
MALRYSNYKKIMVKYEVKKFLSGIAELICEFDETLEVVIGKILKRAGITYQTYSFTLIVTNREKKKVSLVPEEAGVKPVEDGYTYIMSITLQRNFLVKYDISKRAAGNCYVTVGHDGTITSAIPQVLKHAGIEHQLYSVHLESHAEAADVFVESYAIRIDLLEEVKVTLWKTALPEKSPQLLDRLDVVMPIDSRVNELYGRTLDILDKKSQYFEFAAYELKYNPQKFFCERRLVKHTDLIDANQYIFIVKTIEDVVHDHFTPTVFKLEPLPFEIERERQDKFKIERKIKEEEERKRLKREQRKEEMRARKKRKSIPHRERKARKKAKKATKELMMAKLGEKIEEPSGTEEKVEDVATENPIENNNIADLDEEISFLSMEEDDSEIDDDFDQKLVIAGQGVHSFSQKEPSEKNKEPKEARQSKSQDEKVASESSPPTKQVPCRLLVAPPLTDAVKITNNAPEDLEEDADDIQSLNSWNSF